MTANDELSHMRQIVGELQAAVGALEQDKDSSIRERANLFNLMREVVTGVTELKIQFKHFGESLEAHMASTKKQNETSDGRIAELEGIKNKMWGVWGALTALGLGSLDGVRNFIRGAM